MCLLFYGKNGNGSLDQPTSSLSDTMGVVSKEEQHIRTQSGLQGLHEITGEQGLKVETRPQ